MTPRRNGIATRPSCRSNRHARLSLSDLPAATQHRAVTVADEKQKSRNPAPCRLVDPQWPGKPAGYKNPEPSAHHGRTRACRRRAAYHWKMIRIARTRFRRAGCTIVALALLASGGELLA